MIAVPHLKNVTQSFERVRRRTTSSLPNITDKTHPIPENTFRPRPHQPCSTNTTTNNNSKPWTSKSPTACRLPYTRQHSSTRTTTSSSNTISSSSNNNNNIISNNTKMRQTKDLWIWASRRSPGQALRLHRTDSRRCSRRRWSIRLLRHHRPTLSRVKFPPFPVTDFRFRRHPPTRRPRRSSPSELRPSLPCLPLVLPRLPRRGRAPLHHLGGRHRTPFRRQMTRGRFVKSRSLQVRCDPGPDKFAFNFEAQLHRPHCPNLFSCKSLVCQSRITCGQSYKGYTIVNYDSRVVLTRKFPI